MAGRKEIEPGKQRLPDPTLGPSDPLPPGYLAKAHASFTVNVNAAADPLIGTVLSDRYRITEKIGEGGMGKIYLAEDERLGKKVVVKMLPQAFAGKEELARRFVQEAKLTSKIEQENIVSITDLVVAAPPFYVMEHLRGTELGALLHNEGRLQWDERTRDMLAQVCRALGAAHEQGIVHRDMKPDNIFLVEHSDGRLFVKILDFGIAKLLSESGVEADKGEGYADIAIAKTGRHNLTNIGTVLGTPHYMAPEQGRGEGVDHRSDIYAVGVIMYELLTGQVPFDVPGRTGMDIATAGKILDMHVNEQLIPPSARRPEAGIPEDVEAVILKAMHKSPQERFADIREMGAMISKCAAPRHKPKAKAVTDGNAAADDGRSLEGLVRIRKEDENRRKNARIKAIVAAGAIAAIAAGASAFGINEAFRRRAPVVHSAAMPAAQEDAAAQTADGGIGGQDGLEQDSESRSTNEE